MAYDFNSLTKQADEASNRDGFYTDFEDVDPSVLHQISELTEWMRTKAKGSDVREVIAQLFERTWIEEIKEGNANFEVAQARANYDTLGSRLNDMTTRIGGIAEGSPKGTYPNLAALQAANPNGDGGIYVTSDNGHWYYYNNGWKDGGVYQATGIADGSITTEKTNFVKSIYNLFDKDSVENDYYYYQQSSTGKIIKSIVNTDYRLFDKIKIVKGTRYFVSMPDLGRFAFVTDINEINLGLL